VLGEAYTTVTICL